MILILTVVQWTMEGPHSSYSCLEIHICWKVEREARMEPPIQTEYFLSGGAMILILTVKREGMTVDSNKDVVNECRRARVRDQCARLQPRVVLSDKAPSWRDRMAGMVGPSRSVQTKCLKPKVTVEEPVRKWSTEPVKKKSSTYVVNVDVNTIRIVDEVRAIEE